MSGGKEKTDNGGCFKIIIAIVGFILLLSPLNPFVEYKSSGEDEILTNSSWLVVSVMAILYWVIIFPLIRNKK